VAISQTRKRGSRGDKLKSCLLAATILAITTLPVLASSGTWQPYLPLIHRVIETHDPEQRLQIVLAAGEDVYRNRLKLTRGDQMEAREMQIRFLTHFGIDRRLAQVPKETEK
jgi:hypothetical protein